jgi:nucleoid DNA-binding protein
MTKAELIERVHAKKHLARHLTKKAVAQIVDAVFLEMGDYFIRTKVTRNATAKLTYPGFGTFLKRRRGERTVKNPQNGDPIVIPPQSTITFSPGQELRSLLNRNGKSCAKEQRETERHASNGYKNGEATEKNGQPVPSKSGLKSSAKSGPQ